MVPPQRTGPGRTWLLGLQEETALEFRGHLSKVTGHPVLAPHPGPGRVLLRACDRGLGTQDLVADQ